MRRSLASRVWVVPSEPAVAERPDAAVRGAEHASRGRGRQQRVGGRLLVARHDEAVRLNSGRRKNGEASHRVVSQR